jgi:hypothetical protein
MALDPLTAIAGAESSYGTNLFNPTSSATGIFQDLSSTWQSGLTAIGGNPSQYPTAASAPASVQFAVNSYLYNTQGFAPWTVGDPALAAQIAAAGGASAFTAPGTLSTNPSAYAALDQPGALAAYFASNGGTAVTGGGGDGLTVTSTAGTTGAATAGTATAGGGVLTRPFEWAYQQLITGVIGQVNTSINQVETLANGPLSAILVLAVIVMGIGTLMGRMPIGEFKSRILRMVFVIAFVAPGNTFYQNWVENAVLGLPTYFANAVARSGPVSSTTVSAPAQMFDGVYTATWADAEHIWHETPWSTKAVFVGLALVVILCVMIGALVSMFFVFAAITFLALVMLCVGPIFILGLLFRSLDRFLRGFVDVMVTLLIMLLIIDIVLGFFMTIMQNLMATFAPGLSPNTDLPGFAGMAIVLVVMGYSMTHLARLVERVGGGVTIALDRAGYWMRGQALADAARLASRTAALLGRG